MITPSRPSSTRSKVWLIHCHLLGSLSMMRSLLRSFSMGLMRTMILSLKTLMDVTHRCRLAISMHAFSTPNRGSLLAAPLASTRKALLRTLLSAGAPAVPSRRRRRPQETSPVRPLHLRRLAASGSTARHVVVGLSVNSAASRGTWRLAAIVALNEIFLALGKWEGQ